MQEQQKVLFVVYRTEWWGCFDSLCRQECQKENVICYVMPVPRYARNRQTLEVDMNKRYFNPEMLEGQLPKGVELVDYTTFSLEQGFDRIYIHNPFDNNYVVDSVDSRFYSQLLKEYAKQLIYVPHLLFMGGVPEQYKRCVAYENVDKILLSDNRVRCSLEVMYDEKVEIVPAGIVEYLDCLNAKKPECKKGSLKRLLYCVSFNDLYYGTEKQIQKMWDIFTYMETRKDVVLIFRPDEDIQYRYQELDPGVVQKYEELLEYFKQHEIGELDESLNPYQAAVDADGIMSDGHVMNLLFSVQGKFVLRVDKEHRLIPTEEDRCVPIMWATTVEEKENELVMWFVPGNTRLLCKMVLPNGQVEVVSEVPDEMVSWQNYIDIVKVDGYLYLAPYGSDGIWKYDLERKQYSKQYIPNAVAGCMTRIIPYGEYLYMVPRNYPGIVKYHKETEEIRVIDDWVDELNGMAAQDCKKDPYFIWAVKQEKNKLYMASSQCDAWMEMDLDTDAWKIKRMEAPKKRFIDMVKVGEWVWLLPFDGQEIIKWNCETLESQVVCVTEKVETKNAPYAFLLDLGSNAVAFPQRANNLLKISKEITGKVDDITEDIPCGRKDYMSEFIEERKAGYQYVKELSDGRILAYEYYDGAFLILDRELRVVEKIPCRLPIEEVRKQQAAAWHIQQCRSEFAGGLHEGYYFPAMMDFFVEYGDDYAQEIKNHYIPFLIGYQQGNDEPK